MRPIVVARVDEIPGVGDARAGDNQRGHDDPAEAAHGIGQIRASDCSLESAQAVDDLWQEPPIEIGDFGSERLAVPFLHGGVAKRGVIDGETTLLGTYNIDPRSANLNSELMLVCRGQKELAAEVLASIAAREAASATVIDRGKIVQRSALLGASPVKHRMRFILEMPIANLFDFLL